jgi:hypothetical protein
MVVADHFEGEAFLSAFKKISIVFHDGLAIDPRGETASFVIIEASKSAGVDHFILSSVIQPIRTKLQTHEMRLGYELRSLSDKFSLISFLFSQGLKNTSLNLIWIIRSSR